ncbi:hypothetical protein HRR78_002257 [Exophiala dermatitidis]|nr:hypothetical protein HRR75_001897 [Exophiala dermatitidis]KAJ4556596.1 hypothetical protein HRR78_002257 [Exophiala dermatitidis]
MSGRIRRNRTGCKPCRRRGKRVCGSPDKAKACDENKPMCKACERLSLTCRYSTEFVSYTPRHSLPSNQHRPPSSQQSTCFGKENGDSGKACVLRDNYHVPKVIKTSPMSVARGLSLSQPDMLYFGHFERLVRASLPPAVQAMEFHTCNDSFLRFAVLCLAASHLSTLDASLTSRSPTGNGRGTVTSPVPSPLHQHHARRYHDIAQKNAVDEDSHDPSLVLIGKVLLAYYHHASTDHLKFRLAVWETIRFVRRRQVQIMASPTGDMALQLWYRLCNSHRPAKPPALLIDGEEPSLSGSSLAFPGADEHLHCRCIIGMSSDDLIYDILFKTMELRRRILLFRGASAVLKVPESSPELGVLVYRLLNRMMDRPVTQLEEQEAASSFVRGEHLLGLLEVQIQRLGVWRSRVSSSAFAPKQTPRKCEPVSILKSPHLSQHGFVNHRDKMNYLYYLLCILIFESTGASQISSSAPWRSGSEASKGCDIMNEALCVINTIDFQQSALVDIYAFSLAEVLLQLCYTFPSTEVFNHILDVVWPRMEAGARGYENSHMPTHLAKRIIALIADEWHNSRRVLLAMPAVPEDTPKSVLFDLNHQFDVVVCGCDTTGRGSYFIDKIPLP